MRSALRRPIGWLSVLAIALVTASPVPALAVKEFVAFGADAGGGPQVKVADARTGVARASFFAYDAAFRGGVRVALGDVNGDGVDDLVTAPGPGGGPHVRVFDGTHLLQGEVLELASFLAADSGLTNGLYVAVGEVDPGNGAAREVIAGYGEGAEPRVKVFRVAGGGGTPISGPLGSFLAFDAGFLGGVRVAAADVTGTGVDDIVAGAGPGGGPAVRVFDGNTGQIFQEFLAYDAGFLGGVYVAAGDTGGGAPAEVITGPGFGSAPEVRIYRVTAGSVVLANQFFCYDSGFPGGVRVGYVPQLQEVVCTPGPGYISLAVFSVPPFPSAGDDIAAYDSLGTLVFPNFQGGVFSSPN